ncbi:MAG: hypothetical protein RIS73_436 [Bacteroidota bacterium]|jgi:hypothetical protein
MKKLFIIYSVSLILLSASCQAQKLVQGVNDAKKLETNKENFIGKPLKNLLTQIIPKIKFVYGNPENKWAGANGGTYLNFHFIDKEQGRKKINNKQNPTAIIIEFTLDENNKHKPLPKGGLKEWTSENTNEYGDMIIANIRVIGGN